MRRVDEQAEEMARLRQKKRQILAAAAIGVLCASFYGWWRKTLPAPAVWIPPAEVVEASRKAPAELVIYVSGMVEHPGVVKVAAGMRALDAVNAAGGLLPGADASKLNLAQLLRDGMQIHVPGKPQPGTKTSISRPAAGAPAHPTPASAAPASPAEKVNINTADAPELDKLPGIGPAMAAKIVEWRNANGQFQSGEDLKQVKGIGESKYQKLKDKISW